VCHRCGTRVAGGWWSPGLFRYCVSQYYRRTRYLFSDVCMKLSLRVYRRLGSPVVGTRTIQTVYLKNVLGYQDQLPSVSLIIDC
jgi:hypothetical protein